MRRDISITTRVTFAFLTVCVLMASQAAAETIKYIETWNIGATNNGVRGATVDSNGSVYVADYQGNSVRKYDAGGTLLQTITNSNMVGPSGVAISSLDGSIYAASAAVSGSPSAYYMTKFASDGTYSIKWAQPNYALGVTADSSGNVYMVRGDTTTMSEYSSTGSLLHTYAGTGSTGLALNASQTIAYTVGYNGSGDILYATNLSSGVTTTLATGLLGTNQCSIAVNTNTGNIYVAERGANVVQEFSNGGTLIQTWDHFGATGSVVSDSTSSFDGAIYGVAVNSATNRIYVTSQSGKVYVFESIPEPSTMAMMTAAALGLLAYAWRRRK